MSHKIIAMASLVVLAGAGLAFHQTVRAEGEDGPMSGGMDGHHCMHGGHEGAGHGMMMSGMPFGGHMIDRMLTHVKATDAQRAQIKQISDKAQLDLKALHEQHKAQAPGPHGMMALLAQPTIDEAGAEKLRQQMLTHHDAVSKRMLQATIDIAKVLTPAQRALVAQDMQKHEAMMQKHDHEHGEHEPGAHEGKHPDNMMGQ